MTEKVVELGMFTVILTQRPDGRGFWGALNLLNDEGEQVFLADLGRCDLSTAMGDAMLILNKISSEAAYALDVAETILLQNLRGGE